MITQYKTIVYIILTAQTFKGFGSFETTLGIQNPREVSIPSQPSFDEIEMAEYYLLV